MPASTTPKPKTYTMAAIEEAAEEVKASISRDFDNSSFKDAAELICRLFIKRIKEELK